MDVKFILDWSVILVFLLTLIDAAVLFWVALFRLEQIEDALGKSELNIDARRMGSGIGLLGRQYRLSTAIGALWFTNMYVRKGVVDPDDVRNMPPHLKRLVLIPSVSGVVLLLLSFVWVLMTGKI
jgi:hypothetical protein